VISKNERVGMHSPDAREGIEREGGLDHESRED
jgi:hypothetical protein